MRIADRHPLNTEFAWTPASSARTLVSDDQARQWDEQGFFLLEGAIGPDRIAEVTAEIDPHERRATEA
ncbi:MAG TPA: hypothetical protein VK866_03815, partial [Acidimicrobiales bacterium]|nr:hypothetical protein [Acidimicrobiales bacterium]